MNLGNVGHQYTNPNEIIYMEVLSFNQSPHVKVRLASGKEFTFLCRQAEDLVTHIDTLIGDIADLDMSYLTAG